VNKVEGDKIFSKNITLGKVHASYPVVCDYGQNEIIVSWSENGKIFYRLVEADGIKDEITLPSDPHNYRIAVETEIKLSNHKDPVCGMYIDNDAHDTTHFDSKVIGFCSKHCKDKFIQSPREYKID